MDTDGRFSLGSDEFTRLIGPRIAAGFGRPWREIAETYGLDPAGRVLEAIATRDTWSGITIYWPVDGGGRLPVELSGLPIDDPTGNFAGYRGLGVCRVLDSLGQLEELRGREPADDDVRQGRPAHSGPQGTPPPQNCPRHPMSCHPYHLELPLRLLMTLRFMPIWMSPWTCPRTSCRSAPLASRNRRR